MLTVAPRISGASSWRSRWDLAADPQLDQALAQCAPRECEQRITHVNASSRSIANRVIADEAIATSQLPTFNTAMLSKPPLQR